MPIYEYRCDGCQEVFEVFQKVSDPPPASHSCGSTQVQRVLSNTSFVLKGTGWYATDYARKDSGGGKASSKTSTETSTDSSSSESKGSKDSGSSTSGGSPSPAAA